MGKYAGMISAEVCAEVDPDPEVVLATLMSVTHRGCVYVPACVTMGNRYVDSTHVETHVEPVLLGSFAPRQGTVHRTDRVHTTSGIPIRTEVTAIVCMFWGIRLTEDNLVIWLCSRTILHSLVLNFLPTLVLPCQVQETLPYLPNTLRTLHGNMTEKL